METKYGVHCRDAGTKRIEIESETCYDISLILPNFSQKFLDAVYVNVN